MDLLLMDRSEVRKQNKNKYKNSEIFGWDWTSNSKQEQKSKRMMIERGEVLKHESTKRLMSPVVKINKLVHKILHFRSDWDQLWKLDKLVHKILYFGSDWRAKYHQCWKPLIFCFGITSKPIKKKRKVKEKITNHKPSHLTTDIVDSLAVIKVDWNQNTRRNPNENEKVEK